MKIFIDNPAARLLRNEKEVEIKSNLGVRFDNGNSKIIIKIAPDGESIIVTQIGPVTELRITPHASNKISIK